MIEHYSLIVRGKANVERHLQQKINDLRKRHVKPCPHCHVVFYCKNVNKYCGPRCSNAAVFGHLITRDAKIVRLRDRGTSYVELEREFGLTTSTLRLIYERAKWKKAQKHV